MEVVILGPNLPTRDETFHVHRAGCKDLRKMHYRNHLEDPIEMASHEEVAKYIYPPEDFEYDPAKWPEYDLDFKYFNCCAALPLTEEDM